MFQSRYSTFTWRSLLLAGAAWSCMGQAAALEPNVACIAANCGLQLGSCAFDSGCRTALGCVQHCTSNDAEVRQTCLITCVESTPTTKYDALTSCIVQHSCLPKPAPRSCPWPSHPNAMASVALSDLEGTWYVLRGLSPAYDCWSCQTMKFTQQSSSQSRYDYAYMVKSPLLSRISCSISSVMDDYRVAIPGRFHETYVAHGVVGNDDWFVLSQPHPDYALLYYCGTSAMDSYQGAVVITRSPNSEIPAAIVNSFRQALKDADFPVPITLDSFCSIDNDACPNTVSTGN